MKWLKLYRIIGEQRVGITKNTDVYAVDSNGVKRNLELKFDKNNCPYLAFTDNIRFKTVVPGEK